MRIPQSAIRNPHWPLAAVVALVIGGGAMYPNAPVGLPEGADSAVSTYGHLVDCYLEILADREVIGRERTDAVVADKGHYTWIYATVLRDEKRISDLVDRHHLRVR